MGPTDVLLIVAGTGLVLTSIADLAATAVSLSSVRGPLSQRISSAIWWALKLAGSVNARRFSGAAVSFGIFMGWLASLALGWSMIFSAEGALANSTSSSDAGADVPFTAATFFAVGSLLGRGSSPLSPEHVFWSAVEATMSLTGVALLSLSLAWILPVVSAVVQKRALAAKLSALGGTPAEIIDNGWNGEDLGDLNLHLIPLIDDLSTLAQRHLAYPVIHYFHSTDERTAIGPRITALDEALLWLEAVDMDQRHRGFGLGRSTTVPVRQAISDYLTTLESEFFRAADEAPKPPAGSFPKAFAALDMERGEVEERIREACDHYADRRALLQGYLEHDGWCWHDVTTADDADVEAPDADDAKENGS